LRKLYDQLKQIVLSGDAAAEQQGTGATPSYLSPSLSGEAAAEQQGTGATPSYSSSSSAHLAGKHFVAKNVSAGQAQSSHSRQSLSQQYSKWDALQDSDEEHPYMPERATAKDINGEEMMWEDLFDD